MVTDVVLLKTGGAAVVAFEAAAASAAAKMFLILFEFRFVLAVFALAFPAANF